jgi:sugar lactone lactonase YvrE
LNKPYLAVDGAGNVYASDPEGYRILRFTAQGGFVASYGEYGVDASRFNLPMGLVVDGQGRLIVADSGNHRVMVFGPLGP